MAIALIALIGIAAFLLFLRGSNDFGLGGGNSEAHQLKKKYAEYEGRFFVSNGKLSGDVSGKDEIYEFYWIENISVERSPFGQTFLLSIDGYEFRLNSDGGTSIYEIDQSGYEEAFLEKLEEWFRFATDAEAEKLKKVLAKCKVDAAVRHKAELQNEEDLEEEETVENSKRRRRMDKKIRNILDKF